MLNVHDQTVFHAGLRAIKAKMGAPHAHLPHGSALTALMKHGGLYTFLDSDVTNARIVPLVSEMDGSHQRATVQQVQSLVDGFFYRLCPLAGYVINSDLMSYITFPHDGVAFENSPQPNPRIPAIFTFVGQFIDHDLTMNAVNLTLDQTGNAVVENASPTIDLDNIYGPRKVLNNALLAPGEDGKPYSIFDNHGKFKLKPIGKGFDIPRPPKPDDKGLQPAFITDARNDENQLVLQIHVLLMRVHNKLIEQMKTDDVDKVRRELVTNFQSVVLNEYLPLIIEPKTLEFVLSEIRKPDFGKLKHKPLRNLVDGTNVVRMPHEFAIGFRFGHSQLRPAYKLNSNPAVALFNNRHDDGADDLRGSRPLAEDHVIDWDIFYPQTPPANENPPNVHQSLLIDGKITPPVFDLPETAIPDDIKFVGNLPHRNLIRSRMVGVVSGEELAEFYGVPHSEQVTPGDIVDKNAPQHVLDLFRHDGHFKTPLWYYILKEAEVKYGGQMLGPLGSRLVAEVLAGALFYGNEFRFGSDPDWKSAITGSNVVTMRDLINYVTK